MKILSVNSSAGRVVTWQGREVRTGIFKIPVDGPVKVSRNNIEGDQQSDLRVHGGYDKAIYAYAFEDYQWWTKELNRELEPGAFGENLTTEGLDDRSVHVGDIFRAGTVLFQAVQPRLPCYKLGIKFDDVKMPKRFVQAGRWGIYFRVLKEGTFEAGDSIELLESDSVKVSINDLASLAFGNEDTELAKKALRISSLNESWRESLTDALAKKDT